MKTENSENKLVITMKRAMMQKGVLYQNPLERRVLPEGFLRSIEYLKN